PRPSSPLPWGERPRDRTGPHRAAHTGGESMTAHQPSTADTREIASAAEVLARVQAYVDTFVVGQQRLRESLLIGLLTEATSCWRAFRASRRPPRPRPSQARCPRPSPASSAPPTCCRATSS